VEKNELNIQHCSCSGALKAAPAEEPDGRRCAPPIGLRDHAFRGYAAHSAAYPLNAAAPLCGFAPIGTPDALISQPVMHLYY